MTVKDLGANVRRHMKLAGMTIPKLAEKSGMAVGALSNIMNGKSEPRSSTLIKISDALDVTVSELLSETPALKSLRFRTLKNLSGREKAERDQLIHETALWLRDYRELEDLLGEHREFRLKGFRAADPVSAAADVRRIFGLDEAAPIPDIASLLDDIGVKLRIKAFGYRKTNGLSVGVDDNGPAIVVNAEKGISVERQIFTAAHEFGHLLLHAGSYGIEADGEDQEEERQANEFAGAFLVPGASLRKEWDAARGEPWIERILHIKKYFKVSYQTIIYRLQQMDDAMKDRNLRMEFAVGYKKMTGHDLRDQYEPDPVADFEADGLSRNDFHEERFKSLVRLAFERDEISISRAAEILGYDLKSMRELALSWRDL